MKKLSKIKTIIKKGFTLVELVVVIAVIAILSIASVITYTTVIDKAKETSLISQAKEIMTSDVIKAEGSYLNIPPLIVDENNIQQYIGSNFEGYYDANNNTWNVIIDSKLCTFNLSSNTWTIRNVDSSTLENLLSREDKISFLTAENQIKQKATQYETNDEIKETCTHAGMHVEKISDRNCFYCELCGLYGVDLLSHITKNPTTSQTGTMQYEYKTSHGDFSFTREIPKAKSNNWFWAFYNDQDLDGMPEFNSYQYIDYTTVEYKYLYKSSDFTDYPTDDLSFYGGFSDDQWNDFYNDWDQALNVLYSELAKYEQGSTQYNDIMSQINTTDQYYSDLETQYYEQDDAAYLLYEQACEEYEQLKQVSLKSINPNKTKVITEKQKLYYFLHVPFDYDETKSYPVLVFYPGSGATLFSYYGTSTENANTLKEGDFYFDKYRQTKSNGLNSKYTQISSSAMDREGNWLDGQLTIRDGDWCGAFFSNWYNQVKDPGNGRDMYDCFILFLQPSDSSWWSSSYYISMTNQVNVPEIPGAFKITPEMTGDNNYKGYTRPTYDSSYVSPAPDGQLACKLIDNMSKTYNIDLKRQYVAGGSLGGAFTMDMINQYHDRFACGIPVVAASVDLTEKTADAIVKDGMNVWAISGDGDTNCNKYFSKLFAQGLNEAKTRNNINDDYIYQYSLFPGGHSCAYIGATLRTAAQGVSITYANQVLDFMFNSTK